MATSWTSYIESEERANYGICFEAAENSNYTKEAAEKCDNGHLGCVGCPWQEQKPLAPCLKCYAEVGKACEYGCTDSGMRNRI